MHTSKNKDDINTNKVAWLVTTMGYGDSLMYWEDILYQFNAVFPRLKLYLSDKKVTKHHVNLPFEYSIKLIKLPLRKKGAGYKKSIILAMPNIINIVYKYKPNLIVISEFGIISLYGLAISVLVRKSKVLLLVENYPYPEAKPTKYSLRSMIRRFVCKFSDLILTNNEMSRQYLVDKLGVAAYKINVGAYLVSDIKDTSLIASVSTSNQILCKNTQPDRLTFLYVGLMEKRKGIFNLVDAIHALPANKRNKLAIWMVGDGEDMSTIRELIAEKELNNVFLFFGRQPYTALSDFYNKADAFIFPTLSDYRALVGFEAIGFGLPLLHSKYDGAVSEVLKNGKNGILFDPLNIAEFTEKICWFINNREKMEAYSEYSRKLSEEYTVKKAVDNLICASNKALNL